MNNEIITSMEEKLVIIQHEIAKERAAVMKLMAHPLDASASREDIIARQNAIHDHSDRLHALEMQCNIFESAIKKLKDKS